MDIRFTNKQIAILTAIKTHEDESNPATVWDIIGFVFYDVKRDAMLHSLKILIDNGYVMRDDKINDKGKKERCFKLTSKGEMFL